MSFFFLAVVLGRHCLSGFFGAGISHLFQRSTVRLPFFFDEFGD